MTARKQVTRLRQVLVLSLGLNVLFLLLFYSVIFRKDIYKLCLFSGPLIAKNRYKAQIPENFLHQLATSTFQELSSFFSDERFVFGYPVKLWALSVAIQEFDVDISPALSHELTFTELQDQTRTWLLPNVKEQEFPGVVQYLSLRKLPFTSRGLFKRVASSLGEGKVDEECLYSFCHTPEFLYLRTLLAGADREISVASLARMVIRGGSEVFFSLCSSEKRFSAISEKERQEVLLAYVYREEPLAALLLLEHDSEAILHEFRNEDVQKILCLLPRGFPKCQEFLSRYAQTPREQPELSQNSPLVEENSLFREYIVKEGDSLWVISRREGVSIEELMRRNQLSHHRLLPGKVLKLPPKSS